MVITTTTSSNQDTKQTGALSNGKDSNYWPFMGWRYGDVSIAIYNAKTAIPRFYY
ncbi:hypothetical protein VCR8J2_40136 [Vibrio coralliirubri]|nr:hypothetical protein VCR8J2_40136 [Vibrio coralliirubri]